MKFEEPAQSSRHSTPNVIMIDRAYLPESMRFTVDTSILPLQHFTDIILKTWL